MKIGVIAITQEGKSLAQKITARLAGSRHLLQTRGEKVSELLARHWHFFDGFVCIMAAGIVVRAIAPLLTDKRQDPCIVVCDQKGKHLISLLSGHLGGGNQLAHDLADITGGQPVITTASDTLGLVALDLWAREHTLQPPPGPELTEISTKLVNRGMLKIYLDVPCTTLPRGLKQVSTPESAEIIVSHRLYDLRETAVFCPKDLVVGIGCNRGTSKQELAAALAELFADLKINRKSIRNLASIDKKSDEQGLLELAADNGWRIDFFDKEQINSQKNLEISFVALKAVGAIGVAEPTALLSAGSAILISRKRKWKNVTMAVAQVPFTL
ncbi:MAG: cobalamin biosynthesis protein CbiG [Deltaproteobacteria bacterium]|nr:MAG: cobalamin biosynthesis protein CbiG [Deltaproteobacteria bacterium]